MKKLLPVLIALRRTDEPEVLVRTIPTSHVPPPGASRRRLRRLPLAIVALVAVSLTSTIATPAYASDLDVSIPAGGSDYPVTVDFTRAQTFTAGVTGTLDRLEMDVVQTPWTNAPLDIELRTVAVDGSPGSSTLAQMQVPLSAVPTHTVQDWLSVSFPTAPQLTAGEQYALVLSSATPFFGPNSDNPDLAYYAWMADRTEPYAGGAAYLKDGRVASPVWTLAGADHSLRTYMTAAVTDTDGDGLEDARDPDGAAAAVNALPTSAFSAGGQQTAFLHRLAAVETLLLAGDDAAALTELSALRKRVDGCALTDTQPDKNDWIIECSAQRQIRGLIDDLAAAIAA